MVGGGAGVVWVWLAVPMPRCRLCGAVPAGLTWPPSVQLRILGTIEVHILKKWEEGEGGSWWQEGGWWG